MSRFAPKLDSFLLANILTWVFLLTINTTIYLFLSIGSESWNFSIGSYFQGILLNIFFLIVFFALRYLTEKDKEYNPLGLLRQAFWVGLFGVFASVLVESLLVVFGSNLFSNGVKKINFFYNFNSLFFTVFVNYLFFIFKNLTSNQAGTRTLYVWNIFQYLLFGCLIFNFFQIDLLQIPAMVTLGILFLFSAYLSGNMRWVAYLRSFQKVQAIGVLLGILLISAYFLFIIGIYYDQKIISSDLAYSTYIFGMLGFVLLYGVFSLLVLAFNLPTTAVFEQKLDAIFAFQKLTQSMQMHTNEEEIYSALLQNSLNITSAQAGYIEVRGENNNPTTYIKQGIDDAVFEEINEVFTQNPSKNNKQNSKAEALENIGFESFLSKNLLARNETIATMMLFKQQPNGFNEEQKELIEAFTRQTSITLENSRLFSQAIDNEGLKKEMAIATKVQQSLLPKNFNISPHFELDAFSFSAKEVGGDYYDIFPVNEHQNFIIIGDVSGKGTNAAFNMAQMKGIFQSFAHMELSVRQFLWYANMAISRCLEKSSFITVTLMLIDTETQKITITRAGHCPTLYFSSQTGQSNYLEDKGLGLGIVRDKKFAKFIKTMDIHYKSNDMMLLYTDGLTEAHNPARDEYGYENLKNFFDENKNMPLKAFHDKLTTEIMQFCTPNPPDDDCTSIVIRFK